MTWERMLTGEADRGAPLGGAYRPIRRLTAAEAPVPGELAAAGDETVVLADVATLGDWPGWAYAASQHVYGVIDVVRRAHGHDAVLAPCARPLREAADRPGLTGGEAVTIAVSLLRGTHEVWEAARARAMPAPPGAWWLLVDGRPVFVPSPDGQAGEACATTAVGIVAMLADRLDDRVARRLLDEVAAALEDAPAPDLEQLEERLFEAYAPRALDRLLLDAPPGEEPSAAADPAPARTRRELRRRRDRATGTRELGASGWGRAADVPSDPRERDRTPRLDVREIVDAALAGRVAEGVSHAIGRVRDRLRALNARRGAPFVLGGVAAASVVAIGIMWPAGEPASAEPGDTAAAAADAVTPPEPGAGAAPGPTPSPGAADNPAAPDDPVAAAGDLLDRLAACLAAGEAACDGVGSGVAPADGDAVLLPAGERSVALLDDYGDIAVVQVAPAGDAPATVPQAVVLERDADDGWRIRDIHDLAPLEGTSPDDEGAG